MPKETRITKANANVRRSRYAIGAGAALAFLGLGFAARAAHPGASAAHTQRSQTASQEFESEQSGDSFFYDDGSGGTITPSQSSVPSIQSGGS